MNVLWVRLSERDYVDRLLIRASYGGDETGELLEVLTKRLKEAQG
jgi:hypothetical protein